MKKSRDCVLFIGSCDAYIDILKPFFILLKKYWPDLAYDIVLSTETIDYQFSGLNIKNIHPNNPNCTWTERIYDALNKIKSKQIIFMLDDFFLYKKVNSAEVERIIGWLSNDSSIATFTLWNIIGNNKASKYQNFDRREKKAHYKLAMTAGIWNKKWLLKYFKNRQESAWEFEKNAGEQSRHMINPGKFYVINNSLDNILPYNLSRYGLFAGAWLKDTKKLFEDNHIQQNFKKRGWYDEKYSSTSQSKIDAFSLNSYITPYYYLKNHKALRIYSPEQTKSGPFKQSYKIKSGKNFFEWSPSDIYGYSIANLEIIVTYKNGAQQKVKNNLLFGNFKKIKEYYVFNTSEPNVFVTTEKDQLYKRIEIVGNIVFPAPKNQLKESFNKTTPPPNKYCEQLLSKFWFESLSNEEYRSFVKIQPEIIFDEKKRIQEEPRSEGKFAYQYDIPPNTKTAIWSPSQTTVGFSIKNLRIKLFNSKTGSHTYVHNPFSTSFFQLIKNYTIFPTIEQTKFNVTGYDKIIITGKMKRAIKPNFLRKINQ